MIFVHRQAAITKVAKFRGWMAGSPPLRGVSSAACAAGAEIVDLPSGAQRNVSHRFAVQPWRNVIPDPDSTERQLLAHRHFSANIPNIHHEPRSLLKPARFEWRPRPSRTCLGARHIGAVSSTYGAGNPPVGVTRVSTAAGQRTKQAPALLRGGRPKWCRCVVMMSLCGDDVAGDGQAEAGAPRWPGCWSPPG